MMSSKSLVRDIEKRIIAHFMDLLVLSLLNHDGRKMSGYDVLKHLERRFGLMMSPGTVYSQLNYMERRGLLNGLQKGRKRIYTLTPHGKRTANSALKAKKQIVNFMGSLF